LHKRPENVDFGVAIKLEIISVKKKGIISVLQILKFKREVISFVTALCSHVAEKSTIKMILARHARCLIPSALVEYPKLSEKRYSGIMEVLAVKNQIKSSCADVAKK